jgi:hypothetical protein
MTQLLARVLGSGRPELSCNECFALLDRYVELELAGDDAEAGFPGMQADRAAKETRLDLHAAIELVERGCPPRLALRILAPE